MRGLFGRATGSAHWTTGSGKGRPEDDPRARKPPPGRFEPIFEE